MKFVFLVCTEYHLLLTLNYLEDNEIKEVIIIVRGSSKSNRISSNINIDHLNAKFVFWKHDFNHSSKLTMKIKEGLDDLLKLKPDVFCFFQEQDMLAMFLLNKFQANENYLFQDGMKAYNSLKRMPVSLLINELKMQLFLYKNFRINDDIYNVLNSHKYGFRKRTTKLYLTFPEAYNNWNGKVLGKSPLTINSTFLEKLKVIFKWDDSLLQEKNNIIFYLNQPLGLAIDLERNVIKKIINKYPNKEFYIKIHPNITIEQLTSYKDIVGIKLINSKIPAEIFIANITNSIIFAVSSTALFFKTPTNKYFYLRPIFMDKVKRLKKYNTKSPSEHIIEIDSILKLE